MRRLSVSLVELGGGFVHLEAESLEAVDDVAHGRKTARLELGKDEFVVDENFKGARADELVGKVVREPDGAEGHHLVLGDGGVPGGRLREAEKGKDFFAAEKEDDDRELGEPGELGGDDADEGGGILLGLDRAELVRVPFFEELSQFEKVPLRTSAGAQLHENVPGPQQRALLLLRGRLLRDVLRELLVLAAVHDGFVRTSTGSSADDAEGGAVFTAAEGASFFAGDPKRRSRPYMTATGSPRTAPAGRAPPERGPPAGPSSSYSRVNSVTLLEEKGDG
eukprot:CAMPEP_0197388372 /NCGR_PEP_ID=MMETSP1165-20131217/1040_1 /TAXON_ID=284809 /ORGANISM="Chrysocystis fragilis, Strain CCMP3189" /LENGTH=278 /DNA_ID=CAMNT_0042913719 /DNA_START=215 /DNA_END=1050 /DNA_ORIENTATION=+